MSNEQSKEVQEIRLELKLQQVNTILGALGKCPFEEVYAIIGSIQEQARAQLQPPETPGELAE